MMLELESLQRALRPILGGCRKAVGVDRCHGGTISDVYRVTCAPGPDVIVKLYPQAYQWMLEKEVHVYGLLRQVTGVPFPAVLQAEKAGPHADRGFLVLEYLPGIALSTIAHQLTLDEVWRIYRKIGTILRAIHVVSRASLRCISPAARSTPPASCAVSSCQISPRTAEPSSIHARCRARSSGASG